jgi:succinoglycan biosynthesis protein ExoA
MCGLDPIDSRALVVIPCLNEEEHIAGVIASLLDDPDWADPLVVVADGGSTDATRAIVETLASNDSRIRLISNPGRIQSAAVNLAAKTLGADRRFLVRVDAHARYPQAYVSRLMREADRTGATSVVVAMETLGVTCFQKAAAAAQNTVLGAGGSAHRRKGAGGFVDHGHHALFDMAAFLEAGGYDESFSHNEDAEFDTRLVASGGRIWLTPAVGLHYYPRKTPGALFRQYLKFGDGRAKTFLKHRRRPKLRQLLPLAVAPAAALVVLAPWQPIFALPAAIWALLTLTGGLVLGAKAKNPCAASAGVPAMIMHLAWSVGYWRRLVIGRTDVPSPTSAPAVEPKQS